MIELRSLLQTRDDLGPYAQAIAGGPGFSLGWRDTGGQTTLASLTPTTDTGWAALPAGAPTPLQGTLRGEAARSITFLDPGSGLSVVATYVRHRTASGAGAISWRGWIEHRGERPVRRLARIAMLDVRIEPCGGDPTVRSMRGGVSNPVFPPDAYAVHEQTLLDSYRPAAVELDSGGTGRSTDRDAPYLVVADGTGAGGCFAGLGWSALWQLVVRRQGGTLSLEATVQGLDLDLALGERIPLPEVLLGFFTGTIDAGANALRQVLRRDFAPHLRGAPVQPPVSYNHWFQFRLGFHEDLLRPQIAPCQALGVEYFVLDSGWFAGSETSYRRGCGNWGREAAQRLPSGLRALADEVRAHGMGMGLWIDPELIHPESDTGRAHPEWLLPAPDSLDGAAVIDFSQQAARDWAVETIGDLVGRYELAWLRWDVNMPLAPNWASNDPPGKAGWHQLQHVAGVHEVLDRVRQRYPDLLLEGCCGGGRRIDLGLLRRSHTFWCSDMTGLAPVVRAHQSGGNCLLPAGYFNTNLVYGPAQPTLAAAYPPSAWLSHFGGPFGFSADFRTWSASQIAAGRRYVDAFKRWRHLLAGDFHPVFPLPRGLADWDGWQFDDSDRGEGALIVFREQSPVETREVRMGGTPRTGLAGASFASLVPEDARAPEATPDGQGVRITLEAGGAGAWTYGHQVGPR